jgi:hypothetical protein
MITSAVLILLVLPAMYRLMYRDLVAEQQGQTGTVTVMDGYAPANRHADVPQSDDVPRLRR